MKLIQKFGDVLLYASLIVLPLILSVYDRLQGNIDSATLSRHLVFLSYKIPLDALTGFLIGLTSVVLLHSLPLKTQSSQWLRRLFFLACAVVSSFGTVWVTKALLKWVDPIHLHLDAATIERFRNSESTQFTVFVSLFLTLVWQRRRVPLVIQTELNKWWDTTQPILRQQPHPRPAGEFSDTCHIQKAGSSHS